MTPADDPIEGMPTIGAPLRGSDCLLSPVTDEALPFIYEIFTDPRVSHRWRAHGIVPRVDQLTAELWAGVLTQFVVVDRPSHRRVGLVVAYRAEPRNGTVRLAGVIVPEFQGKKVALEGFCLFINYLFCTWPFRKLYIEFPEYNEPQFASSRLRGWKEEGRLTADMFYAGTYWDWVTLALHREDFATNSTIQTVVRRATRLMDN